MRFGHMYYYMVIVRGEGVGYHELKAAMRALMLPVKWLDKSWVSVVSRCRFLCLQSCTLPGMLEWPENVLRWIRKADVLEAMRSYGHSPDDAPWQIRCDDFQWFGPFPCPVKSYRIMCCGAHQTLDNFALYMASWLPTSFVKSCQILIMEKKHHNIHNSQPKLCKSKRKWNLNLLHHPAVGIVPTASLPPVAKTHRHTHRDGDIPVFFQRHVTDCLKQAIWCHWVTDAYFFQVQLAPCGSNFSQHVQFWSVLCCCVADTATGERSSLLRNIEGIGCAFLILGFRCWISRPLHRFCGESLPRETLWQPCCKRYLEIDVLTCHVVSYRPWDGFSRGK